MPSSPRRLFEHVKSFVLDPVGVHEDVVDAIKAETKEVFNLQDDFKIAPHSHFLDELLVFLVVFEHGDSFTVRVHEHEGILIERSHVMFSTDTDFLLQDLRCDTCDRKGFTLEDIIWTDYNNVDVCEACHDQGKWSGGLLHMSSVERRIINLRQATLASTGFAVAEHDEITGC